ncbi:MAG: AIM24 family protein, partial [Flavobacteriales bacterium]|nr:AIM24 family protein [Flavobacteriales bacterium]
MERTSDQLDHRIVGDDMQCVEITLDPGETVIAEAGTLMMMDAGI